MSELPEWTDAERSLLASAEVDRPPATSLRRTLQAASVTAAAGTVAATHAAAATLTGKVGVGAALGKWLLVATCVGGAAVGVRAWQNAHTEHDLAITPAPPSSPPPLAASARQPADEPATPGVSASSDAPASDAPASDPAPRVASARASSTVTQPDLSRDIAALDRARQALRAGRAGEALAALDRYDAEFGKNRALRVEASVLRIEATERSGNHARAQALARAFLARDGKSPYAARVRGILEP
jgi:hypothetical protein